jgi:predicted metalloprotease
MKFNNRARLDTRQVRDVRGRSGGRSGGFSGGRPMPGGLRAGGGIGGILIALLIWFVSSQMGDSGGGTSTATGAETSSQSGSPDGSSLNEQCRTGEDANENADCARVAVINSVQSFWAQTLPEQAGREYQEADTTFFSQSVNTACGSATSAVGPFYCPGDSLIYLDVTFFDDMLEGQLGARGGPFSEAYVIAHEYGHHIQNLLGTMNRVRDREGATSDSVRLELQADCYAGMWAAAATSATDATGDVAIIEDLTQDDIARAIDAAEAVGDDRIQQRSGAEVDPETWTHGSADQREAWFMAGYEASDMRECDTFGAGTL